MPEPLVVSVKATFRVPPDELWAFLADTDRMNRVVDLPPVRFAPFPDPAKTGHYRAEAKLLGLTLAYEEFPWDWVEGRHYRILRRFDNGPIREVSGGVRLEAVAGGTELEVSGRIESRGLLGPLARRMAASKLSNDIHGYARAFEQYVLDPRGARFPALPPPGLVHPEILETRLKAVAVPGPVDRLREHLLTASDLEVLRMRPYALADRWSCDRTETLRFFLHAARVGVLDLVWDILCPSCRMPALEEAGLAKLRCRVHCDTCRIDFGSDLSRSVEARFNVNPAVRAARQVTYCIGGPANTPHVIAQLRLDPGEKRREELRLRAGTVRIRCYQAPGIFETSVAPGGRTAVEAVCEPGGFRTTAPLSESTTLDVVNRLPTEALVVVERETWREQAATAAAVVSLQDFRDLFPAEAVAPGEELGIASLAVLFTDLKGSTELYQRVGDPRAFSYVQNHFRYLVEKVATHRGRVVKTMGDAVMATFASGADAVSAALEMQRGWSAFQAARKDGDGILLKVGVHQGPSIAINNAGRLDYFGTTVNTAARVQGQSSGGDIVVTDAVRADPGVKPLLEGRSIAEFKAALKGLEGEQRLFRIVRED
ncbi:MAG TPA: adenylate/guanylate cyclase domain-containing protein [Planctomycetota bacterium]|nr:adenylate/guanylate cyclase domain-containing protein [Planctomycetota bacterium]